MITQIVEKDNKDLKDFINYMNVEDNKRSSMMGWYVNIDHEKYENWTIVKIDNEIVSCSALQKFANCRRLLTRFCIKPSHRTKGMLQKKYNGTTFAFKMLKLQLQYCKDNCYDHAFFSTEYNRINIIKKHIEIANKIGYYPELLEGKYYTCGDMHNMNNTICWQNICLYKLSDKEFPLVKLFKN